MMKKTTAISDFGFISSFITHHSSFQLYLKGVQDEQKN